jgi:hypothetical protein
MPNGCPIACSLLSDTIPAALHDVDNTRNACIDDRICGSKEFLCSIHICIPRENREGWPLLTVENEVNGDSKSTNERGSFLGWFARLVLPVQMVFCSALDALVGTVQNNFLLTVHYFNAFVLIAQQAGQAAMLGRLSLSKCLCVFL